ncbi:MAG TPA: outer membrane protein assembly factor BamA [Candidatus Binatia bacterium]|jgi:outer membrane protein insertion porin family|nr:outer membrane protein assembly factor BamA [Candidatus Binatia bacterium]
MLGNGMGVVLRMTALLVLAALGTARAQESGPIEKVAIDGNIRVEEDAIRVHLQSQVGKPFERATLDKDIRAVYAMGFFDQVNADVTPAPGGKGVVVTFKVKERPLVRAVSIEGNEKLEKDEIEGALRIRPHTILDPEKARAGIEAAKKLYAEKGYLDARITYATTSVGENEVDVTYTVSESEPIRVSEIEFEGNEAFSSRKLEGLMQTSESSLLTPFTGAGNLNKDVLKTDVERLTAWYYDNGYVTVRIDEPKVERRDDELVITIKIDEGEQFNVGKVSISGKNLPESAASTEGLATKTGETFSASTLRDDVQKLTERVSDDGYAFAAIEPLTEVDPNGKVVDVTFTVDRGSPVTVDRIEVTGNTKTRDNVVRREMRLQEQELFSGTKLRKSREALQRLGFFQEVNITTRRTGADDKMAVVVDVKEAQTGAFSAGAGFSSADSLLFNVRIQENNLFGRGQRLVVNGDIGSIRRNVILSFTEPYFMGTPLTAGFDLFSWQLAFEDFDRTGTGGGVQFTYPVTAFGYNELWGLPLEDIRIGADYRLERAEISDLSFNATPSIRAEEGSSWISSITPRISRNTLNHAFDPTAGSVQDFSVEVAGLGGEQFYKAEAKSRWYYTFLRTKALGDFTYSLGVTAGYGVGDAGRDGDELPLFERYFPGGINSIRGFEARTLGPREAKKNTRGEIISTSPIGGSSQFILNNEIIFPLVQSIGLKGVVFVDAGNAYGGDEDISLDNTRASAGAGVRWLSPLGPLRVELGLPIKDKKRDQKSLVLFSFGGPFQF